MAPKRGSARGAGAVPAARSRGASAASDLGEHSAFVDRLTRALAAELPLYARDGGFIAPGYAPELDELRALRDESRRLVAELQARYAGETGVASLKIRHNNVLGYHIEVTPQSRGASSGPPSSTARRWPPRCATATVELGELESRIARRRRQGAGARTRLFEDLVDETRARAE